MAGLCFYFEAEDIDVWSGKNLDAWNYAAKAAGDIDKLIVINRTDQKLVSPDAAMEFRVVDKLPELQNAVYCVGPQEKSLGWISLWDFDHDVDWYCFGPAQGWNPPDPQLHIPVPIGFHSVHAATVIMAHRAYIRSPLWL